MDQELIAYLDERFRETSRQIESLREETTQQIGSLREETTQQISSLREETMQGFERVDERFRHTGIEIEALSDKIRQVADGVAGANEGLGALEKKFAAEFKDVRASIRAPFENLDKRVRVLETEVLDKKQKKVKGRPPS